MNATVRQSRAVSGVAAAPVQRQACCLGPVGLGLLRSAPAVGAMLTAMAFGRRPLERHAGPMMFGAVALFVTQAFFVFFLEALSAGIQAIRLNYVEFFLKFFEGGGTEFQPLSYERKYSTTTE